MMALAFSVGLWTASRRGIKDNIAPEKIMDIGPWLILGTIVGARIWYVVTFWSEQFAGQPIAEVFKVWRGGLVFYGGLIGATLAGAAYLWIKKLPVWKFADILAPSIALGYVFGRIGCLLNGCCYGRECHLPWAIRFPKGPDLPTTPVHPTQIYDSLLNLGFYLLLAWMYRRKKFDGQVFGAYLIGYSLLRSFVEIFRGDYPVYQHYLGGWATPAQLVSIGILAAGLLLLLTLPRPQAKQP